MVVDRHRVGPSEPGSGTARDIERDASFGWLSEVACGSCGDSFLSDHHRDLDRAHQVVSSHEGHIVRRLGRFPDCSQCVVESQVSHSIGRADLARVSGVAITDRAYTIGYSSPNANGGQQPVCESNRESNARPGITIAGAGPTASVVCHFRQRSSDGGAWLEHNPSSENDPQHDLLNSGRVQKRAFWCGRAW